MKQSEYEAMTEVQRREIREIVAGAVWDGFGKFGDNFDVVLSPDGERAAAISGGADYPWERVWKNLCESDFGESWSPDPTSADYMTRAEFVAALSDPASDMNPPIWLALVDEPEDEQSIEEFECDRMLRSRTDA